MCARKKTADTDTDSLVEQELHQAAAKAHLAESPDAQIAFELLKHLEAAARPWWTAKTQMSMWPTKLRMEWLTPRTDVRQRIVSLLTSLSNEAASRLGPEVQTDLLVAVVEAGDVTAEAHEAAYARDEIAIYAPHGEVLARFREHFPWDKADAEDRNVLVWLLNTLLSDGDGGELRRTPVITPLILRSAIDAGRWQEHIPLKLRAAVDQARLRSEWEDPSKRFSTRDELNIITIDKLVDALPASELKEVLEAAERVLFTMGQSELDGETTRVPADQTEEVAPPSA